MVEMPPVGQNRAAGIGELTDLRQFAPAAASVGKVFGSVYPVSIAPEIRIGPKPGTEGPGLDAMTISGGGRHCRAAERQDPENPERASGPKYLDSFVV